MKTTHFLSLVATASTLFTVSLAEAQTSPTSGAVGGNPVAVDPLVQASPYGNQSVWSYSSGDPVPWTLFHPKDFGSAKIEFSGEGVTPVGTVPPPGVHPRIFFSPEDLPGIRKRLKEDPAGQAAWKMIEAYSHALNLTYDEKADYALPDVAKGSFGVHGRSDQVMRIGGYSPKREDYYQLLSEGKPTERYENPKNGSPRPSAFFFPAAIEAFRCLIDNDAMGAKKLAAAVETSIKFEQARRAEEEAKNPVKPGQPPHPSTPRYDCSQLGLVYDFLYNFMTPDQRKLVHDELVTLSAWCDGYGTFSHAETSRSNWACFSYEAWDTMAIEGEPGFNDLKFLGLYRGWRDFFTYSFFNSGCAYEAEGKLLFGMDAVVAYDRVAPKYGLPLLSQHPLVRRHYRDFTALSITPSRKGYAIFDILGSMGGQLCTPQDVVVAHYLFPNDKAIDFIYGSMVGPDYLGLPMPGHSWNNLITDAIFATAYHPENTPDKLGLPLSFFCGQRAMMMARSSWDTDATFLTMHVRGASGGHPYADRNGIMLAGQGRSWVSIPFKDGKAWQCSTVTFNGCDQSNSTPGRVLDYVDKPDATFMVGDSKYCWDWVWMMNDKNKQGKPVTRKDIDEGNLDIGNTLKPVDLSFNDFAFTKVNVQDYMQPLKYSGHWCALDGALRTYLKIVNNPVIKSYRTAGVVRGPHPYVLVLDDIQHDALPALYEWHLSLMDDLAQVSTPPAGAQPGDIFFAPKDALGDKGIVNPGSPAILIRVLGETGTALAPRIITDSKLQVLTLGTKAVSPAFKVLLYTFKAGDPLPQTSPLENGKIDLRFPDQSDTLAFSASASGKTDLSITRGGNEIIAVNKPLEKLNDPDSDALTQQQMATANFTSQLASFNPDSLPGLVASWDLSKGGTDGYAAQQADVAPFPAGKTWPMEGLSGKAVGISNEGISIPFNFKQLCPSGCTVSFWVKWLKNPVGADKKATPDSPWMGNVVSVNGGSGFDMGLVQSQFFTKTGGIGEQLSSSSLFGWTHIALTTDGQSSTIYVNGRAMATEKLTKPLDLGKKLDLAGGGYGGFSGAYQDVRIYNRLLTPDELLKMVLSATQAQARR